MKIHVGERRLTMLRVFATQSSSTVIRRVLRSGSRAKILEIQAAGGDLECLTKRNLKTHLILAEKLEIIRLHDEPKRGDCKTKEQLADMFQVPMHPLILQLTR